MDNYASGYNRGWRQGTFDKCNRRVRVRIIIKDLFDKGWEAGYDDAYNLNEVRI